MKPDVLQGLKLKKLVRVLGLPRPYAIGLLETMWMVAHAAADPVFGSASDVEAAAEWPGEDGVLAAALVDTRFLDDLQDGRLGIHDYWQHAPKYVRDRRCAAIRRGLGFARWAQVLEAFVAGGDGDDDGTPAGVAEILGRTVPELRRLLEVSAEPMSLGDRERIAAEPESAAPVFDLEQTQELPANTGDCGATVAHESSGVADSSQVVADCRLQPAPLPFPSLPSSRSSLRSDLAAAGSGPPGVATSEHSARGEPARGAPRPQRVAVGRVSQIWSAAGLKPPSPGRIARWLGDWDDVGQLCDVLSQCRDRGYLLCGPSYVHQVLESARRNAGRLVEHRQSGNGFVDELAALSRAFEQQRGRGRATG